MPFPPEMETIGAIMKIDELFESVIVGFRWLLQEKCLFFEFFLCVQLIGTPEACAGIDTRPFRCLLCEFSVNLFFL